MPTMRVTDDEIRQMEQIVVEHGQIPEAQAVIVVQIARTRAELFGSDRGLPRHPRVPQGRHGRAVPRPAALLLHDRRRRRHDHGRRERHAELHRRRAGRGPGGASGSCGASSPSSSAALQAMRRRQGSELSACGRGPPSRRRSRVGRGGVASGVCQAVIWSPGRSFGTYWRFRTLSGSGRDVNVVPREYMNASA